MKRIFAPKTTLPTAFAALLMLSVSISLMQMPRSGAKYVTNVASPRFFYVSSVSAQIFTGSSTSGSFTPQKGWWAFYLQGEKGQDGNDDGKGGSGGRVNGMVYLDGSTIIYYAVRFGRGSASVSGGAGYGGGATVIATSTVSTGMSAASIIAVAGGGGGGPDDDDDGGAGGSILDTNAGTSGTHANGYNGGGTYPGRGGGTTDYDKDHNDAKGGSFLQGGAGYDGTTCDTGGGGGGYYGGGSGGASLLGDDGSGGGGSSYISSAVKKIAYGGTQDYAPLSSGFTWPTQASNTNINYITMYYLGEFDSSTTQPPTAAAPTTW
ncbi:MAG: hypothetical protein LBR73_07555 [Oscillospiraceae bacterium]|jgi:hypothetical protein|nr:hypothetical protein [Oscillospiraceae bacterium]